MSSEKNMNKSGEELWEEFKTSFNSLSENVGIDGASLLIELVIENKKLKKDNEQLREDCSKKE